MPGSVRSGILVLACLAAGACSDSTAPAGPCTDGSAVLLSVAPGAQPQFSWSPACLAFRLGVTDSVGNYMWRIDADSGNALASGVVYGSVPAGATAIVPAVTLQAGKLYAVGLYRATGDTVPNEAAELNARLFRP